MPAGEGPLSITVVCEAAADRRTACELADRVIVEQVDWIEPELLGAYRQWRGLRCDEPHLDVHQVPRLAREFGIKVHGFFGNKPGGPMASVARTALVLLSVCSEPPDAVLIVVDSDNDPERRAGLEQARNARPWSFRAVIVAVAHAERESWVLAGFAPEDERESQLLETLRRKLGFDPTRRPHELTATTDDLAKRSPKRVLAVLTQRSVAREAKCWRDTALSILRVNGARTGLTDFLTDVEVRLVPLFK